MKLAPLDEGPRQFHEEDNWQRHLVQDYKINIFSHASLVMKQLCPPGIFSGVCFMAGVSFCNIFSLALWFAIAHRKRLRNPSVRRLSGVSKSWRWASGEIISWQPTDESSRFHRLVVFGKFNNIFSYDKPFASSAFSFSLFQIMKENSWQRNGLSRFILYFHLISFSSQGAQRKEGNSFWILLSYFELIPAM